MADFTLSVGLDIGTSLSQMQKDINALIPQLNGNDYKIKVGLDIDKSAISDFQNQISKLSSSVKNMGSVKVGVNNTSGIKTATTDISNIVRRNADAQVAASKRAASAEKEHEVSLRQVLSTYREMLTAVRTNQNAQATSTYSELVEQANLFGNVLEIAENKSVSVGAAFKQVGLDGSTAIENAKTAISAFRVELEQTGSSGTVSMNQMYSTLAQMKSLLNSNTNASKLSSYKDLQGQVSSFAEAMRLASSESLSLDAALERVGLSGSTAIKNAKTAISAFKAEVAGATIEEDKLAKGSEEYNAALKRANTLLTQVQNNLSKWTAAKYGTSRDSYSELGEYENKIQELIGKLQGGKLTPTEFDSNFSKISSDVAGATNQIKAAGEATQSWNDRVGSLSAKFGTWLSISQIIMSGVNAVKAMTSNVIELDTAMTELKKVTDESDSTYESFLNRATTRSKELGASLSDTVTATADFARLGYSIEEAEDLADSAIIYKNVGDGIEDISSASESIISTMQAFGTPAKDAMTIVDKFNEVGNKYAISSKGVGDALLRSAAAMKSAGNTIDETIALATAANTVVQDPDKVGKCNAQQYSNVLKEDSYIG